MSKNTTRELTTAELAAELGIEKAAFVKHRSRYEEKIRAAGFNFIKEGSRQNTVYIFNTNAAISIESAGDRIRRIFNVETNGNNKTFDKYLRYIAEQDEYFSTATDLEVAEIIGEDRATVTKVRRALEAANYFSPLEEAIYEKEIEENNWQVVETEEWKSIWRDIFYPYKQKLDKNGYKVYIGDDGESYQGNTHLAALAEIKRVTGFRYRKKYRRVYTFVFFELLSEYVNSPDSSRKFSGVKEGAANKIYCNSPDSSRKFLQRELNR